MLMLQQKQEVVWILQGIEVNCFIIGKFFRLYDCVEYI